MDSHNCSAWQEVESRCGDEARKAARWFSFFFLINLFLFLAALGLHGCTRAFSSCGEQASHCGGFSCCGARAVGARASVVVAHGLSSCGLQALEHRVSSCGART